MTPPPPTTTTLTFSFVAVFIITAANALGSASTTAVTYATATVCAVVAESENFILCYQKNENYAVAPVVLPRVSFQAISGGRSFFCGLRSGGLSLHCWDTNAPGSVFLPKRIYHSDVVQLTDVTVGDTQVCARELHSGVARCWRGGSVENKFELHSPGEGFRFRTITSGSGFSCGVLMENGRVKCWGSNDEKNGVNVGDEIQAQFGNLSMSSLIAGVSHACGFTLEGVLVCKGNNDSGQLGLGVNCYGSFGPSEFSGLALGEDFTCAIRRSNGTVVCWGGIGIGFCGDVSFESIVAGLDFVCGVTTRNLSLMCWGHGWGDLTSGEVIPFGNNRVLPGPCVEGGCGGNCASYPNSDLLCHGSGSICYSCQNEFPLAVPLIPPPPPPSTTQVQGEGKKNMRVFLATLVVGSIGGFSGLCTILYCTWVGVRRRFFLKENVVNSVQTPRTGYNSHVDMAPIVPNFPSNATTLGSFASKRQGSSKHNVDKTEGFSLHELANATNNFSTDNKIGAGSFGRVYKGKLADGREVAVKRGDTAAAKKKKFQEKETAFDSELALLSRLHHKHLVRLVGFCEENDERLLVYEYMANGSLHDHLHDQKDNVEGNSSILNSWKMRIKIALDAARGIEYIHNYAVPPIIHRDIKSSNILLDSNWNARVSDFGLSLIWPETEKELVPTKAVGTVGYIDPEYYVMNVLTTKSDVYGFGVVLLELLTGKRAVFRIEGNCGPLGIVEYAGPIIASGEFWSVLDARIGKPEEVNEVESLELMAYTAMHCVKLEGKERPEMVEIVANLERALANFEGSNSSLSVASCSHRFVH